MGLLALLVLAIASTAGAAPFPGPDEAGYKGETIPYNLRNISGTGVLAGVQCDDCTAGPIALPFTFNFYGNDYSQLRVSSNGFVTFSTDSNSWCCSGEAIPLPTRVNNHISLFWDDMYPPSGSVRYATLGAAPNRQFVIGYYNVAYCCSSSGVLTGEIILHEGSNKIELQYAAAPGRAGRTVAGIENAAGGIGIQLAYGAFNFTNQGFLFTPGPPPPPPPAETIAMPNRDAKAGSPVVVWGITTIPNSGTGGIPTTYTIDFGDGTPAATGNVTDRSYIAVTHTYNTPGIFPVTLTVTRDATTQAATTQMKVFAPAPGSTAERNLRINMAIEDGLRYLWTTQSNRTTFFTRVTTSWGSSFVPSVTSLVVLAFENHGYRLPADPAVEPTGIYEKYLVRRGLNYIFDSFARFNLTRAEPGGDPCQGGVDPGNATGCTGLGYTDFHSAYETSVATLAIAGSGAPLRVVSEIAGSASGGYVVGKTYGEILQRLANTIVWGQANSLPGEGGWYYNLQNGGSSDGSTMGWGVLALLDADAADAVVPAFARTELAKVLVHQLNVDGSLDYQVDSNPNSNYYTNLAKTGIGLQALFFTGAPVSDPRVQAALTYISNRWTGAGAGDQFYCANGTHNKGCGYGMFNVFKALKLYGVDTLPGVTRPAGPGSIAAGDWWADYVDWLLANHTSPNTVSGGYWAPMAFSCCFSETAAISALAELILSPTALVLPTTLALAPATATYDLTQGQTSHTVQATAGTQGGGVVAGATVTFTVTAGPNAGTSGAGVTNAQGVASFTYTSAGQGGTDTIVATLGSLTSNTVEAIWVSNQPPVAQCQDVSVQTSALPGNACQVTTSIDNGSFDPDQGDSITLSQDPAGPYGLGATSVTLTVTDDDEASAQCTATVTVVDDTAPSITCSPSQTILTSQNPNQACSASLAANPTATDNCGAAPVACDVAVLSLGAPGTATSTCTATDGSGNSSACSTSLALIDDTAPVVSCAAPVSAECTGNGGATVQTSASAVDNCSGNVAVSGPGSAFYPLGTSAVGYSAADASGNTAACSTSVTVQDTTPPTISCPAPISVECTSPSGAAVTPGAASASDICAGVNVAGPAAGTYPIGTTTVTHTATDGVGLTASCSATIAVVDTTAPSVSCVPSVNPSGANIPAASKLNEDGFYRIGASDTCTAAGNMTIKIGTYALAQGETIKITQARGQSGVRLMNTMGPLQVKHFQVGPSDAVITATDGQGNNSSVTCLVPPPPK